MACWFAIAAITCAAVPLALGGYVGAGAVSVTPAAKVGNTRQNDLAAVFWSGDMGMWIGFGSDIPELLSRKGIPVVAVNSPALFGRARDRAFAQQQVARSLATALQQTGRRKVAVIGFSFGADVLAATLDRIDPALRQRIASVVLVGPATSIHFHANPLGLFYGGPSEVAPDTAAAGLRGLRVTCIFARDEAAESLCRAPALQHARLTQVDGGHMMLLHRQEVTRHVIDSVLNPPGELP